MRANCFFRRFRRLSDVCEVHSCGHGICSRPARCFIIAQGINIEKTGCLRADVEACPPCGCRTGQSAPVCNILQTGQQDRLSRRYAICDMTSEERFKDNRSCPRRGLQDRQNRNVGSGLKNSGVHSVELYPFFLPRPCRAVSKHQSGIIIYKK